MTEKLSPKEFEENYRYVLDLYNSAVKKSCRRPEDVTLLAATKTVPVEMINYAIESGITHIGENRVQELLAKENSLLPVHKHFIGHLQTNKVRDIVGRVEMIESVDSLRLAGEISKQAQKMGISVNVLLEVNIGGEQSKSGFEPEMLISAAREISLLPGICIRGLMTIPPICENAEQSRKYFAKMYKLFLDISSEKIDNSNINVLSMGMSDDFHIAIEEGATLVRVGTALFGKRVYS